jgi:serine/threonine-protein kinase
MPDELMPRANARIGSVLRDRWRLDAVLGVGGMGTVYRATHRNGRVAAIKILHTEFLVDDDLRKRFLREGYIANAIEHPGAVAVIDDDLADDGSPFLVMELLQGDTVEQRLEQHDRAFSPSLALEVTDRLLDVLACAHDHGIVHRDIKPANLFITSQGQLKVLDFGIARIRTRTGSTRMGLFLGTPGFASPEQARSRPDAVDARADLYAVGATLFTMLTGRHVHEAETETERLALTISQPARSLGTVAPRLPSSLIALVDRALLYNREERWLDAREMRNAVRRALSDAAAEEPVKSEARRAVALSPYDVSRRARHRGPIVHQEPGMGPFEAPAPAKLWRSQLGRGAVLATTALCVFAAAAAIRFATRIIVTPLSDGSRALSSTTSGSSRPSRPARLEPQISAATPAIPRVSTATSATPPPSSTEEQASPPPAVPSATVAAPRPTSPPSKGSRPPPIPTFRPAVASRPQTPKQSPSASAGTASTAPENQVFSRRR